MSDMRDQMSIGGNYRQDMLQGQIAQQLLRQQQEALMQQQPSAPPLIGVDKAKRNVQQKRKSRGVGRVLVLAIFGFVTLSLIAAACSVAVLVLFFVL